MKREAEAFLVRWRGGHRRRPAPDGQGVPQASWGPCTNFLTRRYLQR